MAGISNGPPRGGTRGGRDQFNWDNVKTDQDRECYLGHSVKAATGRWQQNKDIFWYTREKEDPDAAAARREHELLAVKQREEDLMLQALGMKPKAPSVPPFSSQRPGPGAAGGTGASEGLLLRQQQAFNGALAADGDTTKEMERVKGLGYGARGVRNGGGIVEREVLAGVGVTLTQAHQHAAAERPRDRDGGGARGSEARGERRKDEERHHRSDRKERRSYSDSDGERRKDEERYHRSDRKERRSYSDSDGEMEYKHRRQRHGRKEHKGKRNEDAHRKRKIDTGTRAGADGDHRNGREGDRDMRTEKSRFEVDGRRGSTTTRREMNEGGDAYKYGYAHERDDKVERKRRDNGAFLKRGDERHSPRQRVSSKRRDRSRSHSRQGREERRRT